MQGKSEEIKATKQLRKRITIGSVLYALWVTVFILLAVLILAAMFLADF